MGLHSSSPSKEHNSAEVAMVISNSSQLLKEVVMVLLNSSRVDMDTLSSSNNTLNKEDFNNILSKATHSNSNNTILSKEEAINNIRDKVTPNHSSNSIQLLATAELLVSRVGTLRKELLDQELEPRE